MKILFQAQGLINDEYKQFFRSNLPSEVELVFASERDPEALVKQVQDVDIFVGYTISREFLQSASSLKHIQIPWTGFDRMDTALLEDYPNITVSNSHSNSLAIAEHAVSLLIAAAKLLPVRDQKMRSGDWSTRVEAVDSFWVSGKTLGILGYGAIGKKVARMLHLGFDMRVLAVKRHPTDPDGIAEEILGIGDMDKVLRESDYLIVALPLTDETRGILSSTKLDLLKANCVVVNIARGPIIEEKALFESLRDGKIGAAGIDVWYNYPNSGSPVTRQNYPFETLENIVMTPHSAFKIRDRVEEFAKDILENIQRIYNKEAPINQVYKDLGY